MTQKQDTIITVSLFIALTALFHLIGFWLIFRLGKATPLMLSVGVAAIVTSLLRKQSLNTWGWSWGKWKYQWTSYLLPFFIIATAYAIIWITGVGGGYNETYIDHTREGYNLAEWNDASIIAFHFLITATITFLLALPSVLGEEIAWRGFLVTALMKSFSFKATSLISGFLWSVFHWPLMFMGFYGVSGTPLPFQVACFTVYIMSASVIMTYLRVKTDSLWTGVIFHMSANVFLQKYFSTLTQNTETTKWYGDEFGLLPASLMLMVAIYYWLKSNKEFNAH
ncbi:type II CAAX endopeptidase family protein [Temperatibacter marinus]|uniref:Type II CAAX endopeptidase family protein n=1 Tax=Temperatibacter marinus TaxID=1456591 RepID=A0AA52EJX2_9PROT|nr:type II CAAX endopeptidase family protein [Temperatibacter marinus]WND03844.1 type II CAAX endopeptidase family protein [Temperatibacter marinus]